MNAPCSPDLPLLDALYELADRDCSRFPSARLADLVGKALAGHVVFSAAIDPFGGRRDVAAEILTDAVLVAGIDFDRLVVMGGMHQLYAVRVRAASQDDSPTLSGSPDAAPREFDITAIDNTDPQAARAEAVRDALQHIVVTDRPAADPWTWEAYEAALAGTGAVLNRDKERLGGIRDGARGAPPTMALALLSARFDWLIETGAAATLGSRAAIGRALHAWLVEQHGHLAYARSLDLNDPRGADRLMKTSLRRAIPNFDPPATSASTDGPRIRDELADNSRPIYRTYFVGVERGTSETTEGPTPC